MVKKAFFTILTPFFIFGSLILPRAVLAHCPLCVAGAAAGITLTRWVGVDDAITGVWIGAFLGAVSFWTYSLLNKKVSFKEKTKFVVKPLIYLVIFGLTIWSFYQFRLIIRMSQIFGLDKLTFGIVAGGALFYLVDALDNALIRKKGKVFFPYQRIIVSLGAMLFLSLAIYILINFFI